jgi:hypothetical protein
MAGWFPPGTPLILDSLWDFLHPTVCPIGSWDRAESQRGTEQEYRASFERLERATKRAMMPVSSSNAHF